MASAVVRHPLNIPSGAACALIFANGPLGPRCVIESLWTRVNTKVCADGGSSRLFDAFEGRLVPDYVLGDLDSSRPATLEHFKEQGAKINKVADQDTNDLEKCVAFCTSLGIDDLVVVGALGGRLDQIFANLRVILKGHREGLSISLVGASTYATVIPSGKSTIEARPSSDDENGQYGFIPLDGATTISTRGMKWDMEGALTDFFSLLSTSNAVVSEDGRVFVECDRPMIWTGSLREQADQKEGL